MLKNIVYKLLKKSDHVFKKTYNSYNDYIDHQKEKTSDENKRQIWLNDEWDSKVNYFKNEYEYISKEKNLDLVGPGIGFGARTGQEVQAMLDIGLIDSIGVDLVPSLPLVVEGDIHNLQYKDNTFGFAFTNIYDHALYPDKFLAEMVRCLKVGGIGLLHLQVGMTTDSYGVVDITSTDTIVKNLKKLDCEIIANEKITQNLNIIHMSTRIIFKKNNA